MTPQYAILPAESMPGGVVIPARRDTREQHRMRQGLRYGNTPRPSADEVWAAMPLAVRQNLCMAVMTVFEARDIHSKAWGDIEPRLRIIIGAEARRVAACLL